MANIRTDSGNWNEHTLYCKRNIEKKIIKFIKRREKEPETERKTNNGHSFGKKLNPLTVNNICHGV